MPTSCCWVEAAICFEERAETSTPSASCSMAALESRACCTPASMTLADCSAAITAAPVAFWMSARMVRT